MTALPPHPAFAPLHALGLAAWLCADRGIDSLASMLASSSPPVTNAGGLPVRPVAGAPGTRAEAYERSVYERGELPVRPEAWHDRFNVAAWRMFPRTKAVLNAGHVAELDRQESPVRSRRRDAFTALDEEGLVIACADPILETCVREFRWRELFVTHRSRVCESFEAVVLGHALLEKLLDPFLGITGKAVFVAVPRIYFGAPWRLKLALLDIGASDAAVHLEAPGALAPLPVLGLPGWWPANESPTFYDDTDHFRTGRRRDPIR